MIYEGSILYITEHNFVNDDAKGMGVFMSEKKFGWCFIGSGGIANKVMGDIHYTVGGGYPAAVYSRTYENACKFAEKHGATPYKTIEEAFNDPNVKAVYIASPHTSHKEHSLLAMSRGLPVLSEKPIAVTLEDAKEIIDFAKKQNVYFLDGLWTRFNPVVRQSLEMINDGVIGNVRTLNASFCICKEYDPNARHYDPALAGGSLLDIGIYPILYACMIFGEMPQKISAMADYAPNGVEHLLSITMQYKNGAIARLFSGFSNNEPQDATISGTKGYINIPLLWKTKTADLYLLKPSKLMEKELTIDPGFPGHGYQYMFDAAMNDIQNNRTENPLLPHTLSLQVMTIIEEVRKLISE